MNKVKVDSIWPSSFHLDWISNAPMQGWSQSQEPGLVRGTKEAGQFIIGLHREFIYPETTLIEAWTRQDKNVLNVRAACVKEEGKGRLVSALLVRKIANILSYFIHISAPQCESSISTGSSA